ncbi:MAG: hypothetical protein M3O30_16730 [Planctomycetota bacterium]|nr:hypothetical protein [Planctomycetota bacterium]
MQLIIGAILLYAAARATVDLLAGTVSAGMRALGHWVPIAVATAIAARAGRRDLALTIVFSTSVASLTLVFGYLALLTHSIDASPFLRRLWLFVLPAVLIPFLAGFSGKLTWVHALMLLLEGLVILFVWLETDKPQSSPSQLQTSQARPAVRTFDYFYPIAPVNWARELNIAMFLSVTTIGASAAVWGAWKMSQQVPMVWGNAIVVATLAPILMIPMLVTGSASAEQDRAGQSGLACLAGTGAIGVAILNLCVLLPLVIGSSYVHHAGAASWSFRMRFQDSPLVFSVISWRIDNVVLIVLGFLLVPVGLGRWRLGRVEGIALIAFYAIYALMEAAAGANA